MPKPYQSRAEYYYGALTEGYNGELPKPQSREDYYLLKLIEQMGKISSKSVMTPRGSVTFATLPAPNSAELGDYYNVSDSFTTTSDFIEGAGHPNAAGTNVGLVLDSNGNKKWDCFGMNFTVTNDLYPEETRYNPMSPYALLGAYSGTGFMLPRYTSIVQGVPDNITAPDSCWLGLGWLDRGSLTIKKGNIKRSFIFDPTGYLKFSNIAGMAEPSEQETVVDESIFMGSNINVYATPNSVSNVVAIGKRNEVGNNSDTVLIGNNNKAVGGPTGTHAFGRNILAGADGFSGENVPESSNTCFYGSYNDKVYLDAPWTTATGIPVVVVGSGSADAERISAIEIGDDGISIDPAVLHDGKDSIDSYRLGLYKKNMTLSDGTVKSRYVLGTEKYTMFSNIRIMTENDAVPQPPRSLEDNCSICVWPHGVIARGHPDGPIYDKDGTKTFYSDGCCRVLYPMTVGPSFDLIPMAMTGGFLFNHNGGMYLAHGDPGAIHFTKLFDPSSGSVVAQKLNTPVKINGVPFDGSSNIRIPTGLTEVNGMSFELEKRTTSLVPNTEYASEIKVSHITLCGYPRQPDSMMNEQELLKKEFDIHTISATFANGVILGYTGFYWWDSKSHRKYVKSINAPAETDTYGGRYSLILHAPSTTKTIPCSCEHGYAGMVVLTPNNLGKATPAQCTIMFYPSDSFVPGDTIHCEFIDIQSDIATETAEPDDDATIVR